MNTQTTVLDRNEVATFVKKFNKFTCETSGNEMVCACIVHIQCDDYLNEHRPSIFSKLQDISKYRNIFDNQVNEVVDFIMSINDEDFKERIQLIISKFK